jgi:uncharacterized protein
VRIYDALMALRNQIQSDLTAAMKAWDTERVATLRMILASIKNLQVAEGHTGEVTDSEVQDLLAREAKKRSEAAEAYEQAGRAELADKERRELMIVREYLPEELGEEELASIVDEAIAETGASSPRDLGRVMSKVMPKVKGRADGKHVNTLVRQRLGA